jgi:NAD(P)-dependent dehydrogenase (short-subunit alcohol dehydrogenase family)
MSVRDDVLSLSGRVNAIVPDATLTVALTQMAPTGFVENAASMVPLGRLADDDEIAGAAIFLATDLSS